jgi:glycosyltransferase involved in cell wall biosynthesis
MRDIILIVFSKDRAMQLDACLRSFFARCSDSANATIAVLYATTTHAHQTAYDELVRHYDTVHFIREKRFKQDLLSAIQGYQLVLFVTDDSIFIRPFQLRAMSDALGAHRDALGFSLRLGRNINYCYPADTSQATPSFEEIESGMLRFNWPDAWHDFGYPLELSSSLYRIALLLRLLRQLTFRNPNTLEDALSKNAASYASSHPRLLCFSSSVAFAVPANMVQELRINRSGSDTAFTAEQLLIAFQAGKRIVLEPLDGFVPNACHQEIAFDFADACIASPKVTVVIVCHNNAAVLPESIESVLNQSYRNFELVIVDNASADVSAEIAEHFAKDFHGIPVRSIANNENAGPTRARRQGFATSRAKYLLPLDADDKLSHRFLEATVEALEAQPRAGFAYVDALTFGSENWVHLQQDRSIAQHARKNYLAYCALIRRDAYEAVGGYNPDNWGYYEDWDLWLSLREQDWEPVHVRQLLFYYRSHPSLSKRYDALHERYVAFVRLHHPALYREEELARDRGLLESMPDGWHCGPPVQSSREIAEYVRRFHPVNRHWLSELAHLLQRKDSDGRDAGDPELKDLLGDRYGEYLELSNSLQAHETLDAQRHDLAVFHVTDGGAAMIESHYSVQKQRDRRFDLTFIPGSRSFGAAFRAMLDRCSAPFFVSLDEDMILLPCALSLMKAVIALAPAEFGTVGFPLWDRKRSIPAAGPRIWNAGACRTISAKKLPDEQRELCNALDAAGHREIIFPELIGTRGIIGRNGRLFHRVMILIRNAHLIHTTLPVGLRPYFRTRVRPGNHAELKAAIDALFALDAPTRLRFNHAWVDACKR